MKLTVQASKTYDIVSYPDFGGLAGEVEKVFHGKKILIVTDTNVAPLYGKTVEEELKKDYDTTLFIFPAGEKSKTISTYLDIIAALADGGFTRKDGVLALGGGVVGDVAGFAAATYMRGVSFLQCPTSFLAAIDSSVGGKTAVDLPQGKNLLGAFYQPDLVYISLSSLKTLPGREVECGMGEAVKYAFLSTAVLPELLQKGITEELIFRCLVIKKETVEGDEFDKGKRAYLNLGHTIGHAIESLAGFTLSHGACVAKGISLIIRMSQNYYRFSDEKAEKMHKLLQTCGVDLDPIYTTDDILKQSSFDKKKESNGIKFVLIQDIGQVESVLLTAREAKELLK